MKNIFYLLPIICLLFSVSAREAQKWVETGNTIAGVAAGDQCGNSIDLNADGTILAIGSWGNDDNGNDAGHVRVFKLENESWIQVGNALYGDEEEKKGFAVSLNAAGDVVALSTPYYNASAGKVSVYQNIEGAWIQMGDDIVGDKPNQFVNPYSGVAIDLNANGKIVAISNHGEGSSNNGVIKLFEFNSESWNKIAEITGKEWNEQLGGGGLVINGDATVLAARPSNGTYYPYIRVFRKSTEGNWEQVGDSIPGAGSSFSLSLDGTTVVAGTRGYYNGEVYIYENINDTWVPKGDTIALPMPAVGYSLYTQLSSDGNMLLVSQPGASGGQLLTYNYIDSSWVKSENEIWGKNGGDNFGSKISISSNDSIIAVSAPLNDDNGENSGEVRIFKYVSSSPIYDTLNLSICYNDFPYQFGSQNITAEGSYTEEFRSLGGIDSTVTLHLTVNPVYHDTISLTISDTEIPYLFGTQSLTVSGAYTEPFVSSLGCDSIVTLNLSVHITGNKIMEVPNDEVSVYPNPSTGVINIKVRNSSSNDIHVSVYSLNLNLLYSTSDVRKELITIDLSHLPKGHYITKIQTGKETLYRKIALN